MIDPISEIWRNVVGFEDVYQVSNLGRVRSKSRVLKPVRITGGYLAVSLGKNKQRTIHRLVAAAFFGPSTQMVLHKDGNPQNNVAENLYYGDYFDNADDARRHGTRVRGERQHAAKLTEDIVRFIRASPESGAALARRLNVTTACISLIRQRKNWNHV
jgi:hypothetical protein